MLKLLLPRGTHFSLCFAPKTFQSPSNKHLYQLKNILSTRSLSLSLNYRYLNLKPFEATIDENKMRKSETKIEKNHCAKKTGLFPTDFGQLHRFLLNQKTHAPKMCFDMFIIHSIFYCSVYLYFTFCVTSTCRSSDYMANNICKLSK